MGVLNVTPDSFYIGGRYPDTQLAVRRAFELEEAGADILDIGGESSRPGADPISADEEIARVLPVLEGLQGKLRIPISLDTQKAAVADVGLRNGVTIINDVSGLRSDPEIASLVKSRGVALVVGHMRGAPRSMHKGPFARDVIRDVLGGLKKSIAMAKRAGISQSRLLVDPGIGFGKSYLQNFELLARVRDLAGLGYPIVVGPSRKMFIGWALGAKREIWPAEKREWGTAAAVTTAILNGAHIVRVHDVSEMAQVARIADLVLSAYEKRAYN
ncbi:MAG TPA: dihydropteroate synthase [Candidatus Acidoferrales bacterium]|jgi:dihydropteroate synthase|nr:dihydropteroate synthase [Candidatus Acidoferrales bacterium]